MENIFKIDTEITGYVNSLEKEVDNISFEEVCEFKLNKDHIEEIPWGTLNYPGVYLLEIKNDNIFNDFTSWVSNFKSQWEDEKYVKNFTPNLKLKRIKKHSQLEDWIPIYIGKSKRIEGRIHEHIFKELHKTTFALKLNARDNLVNSRFRLSTIKLDLTNYGALMPIIESKLRNKINPLIGKQ